MLRHSSSDRSTPPVGRTAGRAERGRARATGHRRGKDKPIATNAKRLTFRSACFGQAVGLRSGAFATANRVEAHRSGGPGGPDRGSRGAVSGAVGRGRQVRYSLGSGRQRQVLRGHRHRILTHPCLPILAAENGIGASYRRTHHPNGHRHGDRAWPPSPAIVSTARRRS